MSIVEDKAMRAVGGETKTERVDPTADCAFFIYEIVGLPWSPFQSGYLLASHR